MVKRIAIIGAGPVGLFLAIQLAKSRSCGIDLYEKRIAYTRRQIVILNARNVNRLPAEVRNKLYGARGEGCFVKPPPSDQSGRCYVSKGARKLGAIVIRKLEMALAEYVEGIPNVNIIRKDIGIKNLQDMALDYDYIFGADGKRSNVRKWMKGKVSRHTTGYGLVMLFNSRKRALRRTDQIQLHTQHGMTKDVSQHRFRAFRSQGKDNYIAIQLQKSEYDTIKKRPSSMSELPADLQKTCKEAAKFYGVSLPKNKTDVRISYFPIQLTTTDFITRQLRGKARVVIIGDAFMGVNFFSGRGVNIGMDEAVTLARVTHGKASMQDFKVQMRGHVKEREDALGTLNLPRPNKVKKCMKYNKEDHLRTGRKMGKNIKMLSPKNRCMIVAK